MFYYLKVNRNEGYTIRNLRHWLDAIRLDKEGKYIILCDNVDLTKRICDNIPELSDKDFMGSDREDSEIVDITKNNTSLFWNNASYAHLTTFKDAKKRNLNEFYNIDADDTYFCVDAKKVNAILHAVQEDAQCTGIDAYSFDMSHSRRGGKFWTFGVTYINNKVDWFYHMMTHCHDNYLSLPEYDEMLLPSCIDTYFTYMKTHTNIKLETFYVENCKFVHYSNDFVYRPWCSWFAIYRDGRIIKPLLRDFYELEDVGDVEIAKDVRKLDVGLSTKEQTKFLINAACEADRNKQIMFEALR